MSPKTCDELLNQASALISELEEYARLEEIQAKGANDLQARIESHFKEVIEYDNKKQDK